jgi:hypothetical protein
MSGASVCRPLLFAVVFISVLGCQQRQTVQSREPQSFVDRSVKDEDVVVRFYYNPMIDEPINISPGPLILMPVSSQDPRLDTRQAWILYVMLPELRNVLRVLRQANLEWEESKMPKQLVVDPFDLPQPHHDSMEVAVTNQSESATTEVQAKRVCGLLSDISNVVSNTKTQDGLAFYQRTISCLAPEAQRSAPSGNSH